MDLQLKDKVVLITGGAKGIGEAISRGCVREGAIPVFVDHDKEAGARLQGELQNAAGNCCFIYADILPAENCRACSGVSVVSPFIGASTADRSCPPSPVRGNGPWWPAPDNPL